jgi:hypothetical protein
MTVKQVRHGLLLVLAVLLNLCCWYLPWKIHTLEWTVRSYEPAHASELTRHVMAWIISWLKNPDDIYYTEWQLVVYALIIGIGVNLVVGLIITRACLIRGLKKQGVYLVCSLILVAGHVVFAFIVPVYAFVIMIGPSVPLGPGERGVFID